MPASGNPGASQVVLVIKNLPVNAGDIRDMGWIPGSGRSPGGGHGNPFQYSCLGNPMDRRAWQTTDHRVTKSQTWLKQLYFFFFSNFHLIMLNRFIVLFSLLYSSTFLYIQQDGSVQFSSVSQSCPTPCNPMRCSIPGLPVHHQLLESTQTHVHWVGDVIQPSHPLSFPSPPALNLSQHQGLFKWVNFSHQVTKVLELQLQHQSFQWTFRADLF